MTAGTESVDRVVPAGRRHPAAANRSGPRRSRSMSSGPRCGSPRARPPRSRSSFRSGLLRCACSAATSHSHSRSGTFRLTCRDGVALTVDGDVAAAARRRAARGRARGRALTATSVLDSRHPGVAPAARVDAASRRYAPHDPERHRRDQTRSRWCCARVGQPATTQPDRPAAYSAQTWSATSRSVQVQTDVAALLIVHENDNPGWQATLHGTTLDRRSRSTDGSRHGSFRPGPTASSTCASPRRPPSGAGLIGGAGCGRPAAGSDRAAAPPPTGTDAHACRAVRTASPGAVVRWGDGPAP